MIINYLWQFILLTILSYFIGNFCAAVFISKKIIHKDIRELGSKNPGTTNMTRIFGIKYGVATLLIDFFKAFICTYTGKFIFTALGGNSIGIFAAYLAGLAVILGHNYPIVLRFKGGKGFASGIGVFIVVNPAFTSILLLIGVFVLVIVDRMSVCALAFFAIELMYSIIMFSKQYWWIPLFAFIYLVLAIISHWPNIVRLIHGEEKRLGILNRFKRTSTI